MESLVLGYGLAHLACMSEHGWWETRLAGLPPARVSATRVGCWQRLGLAAGFRAGPMVVAAAGWALAGSPTGCAGSVSGSYSLAQSPGVPGCPVAAIGGVACGYVLYVDCCGVVGGAW